MKHKQQPTDDTCSHTCIAMLADISIDDVIAISGAQPLSAFEVVMTLEKCGLSWNRLAFPKLMWGCWHMVTVPSLNEPATTHSILLGLDTNDAGLEIRDPNEGRPGRKSYTHDNLGSWSDPIIVTGI